MITEYQSFLLDALKASLFNEEFCRACDTSWNDVVIEAKAQTVIGLISPIFPVLKETSEQVKVMYMRILFEQDRLIKCFDNAHIPCVIIKGCAAAKNYPMPYLRTMGDIDILVPRSRFIESMDLLNSNGYSFDLAKGKVDRISEDTREVAYMKNGVSIELHQRFSSVGLNVDSILETAIDRREYCVLNGFRFPILPLTENGLVLLGHINQHLKQNELGLRQIIDWAMYIHSIVDKDTWIRLFLPLLEQTELLSLAAYVTEMCKRYLGLPDEVSFGVNVDSELVEELMEIILCDGNFGRKVNADKTFEDKKLISAAYGIKRYGFFGYFIFVGLQTSVFCRKHCSVKFIAFIYGFFRQLFMGVCIIIKNKGIGNNMNEGKKKYNLYAKRYELYKKLGVRTGEE